MSKLRKAVTGSTYATGLLFAFSALRIPESWRGHLPEIIDIASTSSNLIPGIALGIAAMELTHRTTDRSERRLIATCALGFSTLMNFTTETTIVNSFIVPDEAHIVIGYGDGGETRDIEHGIAGTALGLLFSSVPGTRRRKAEGDTTTSPDESAA